VAHCNVLWLTVGSDIKNVTSGVCLTDKTGFGFNDRIYWTFIQLVTTLRTNHSLTQCHLIPTGHSTGSDLTSNWTALYSVVLFQFWTANRVLCYDRRPVGQLVLVSSTHLGLTTRFVLLSYTYGFADGRFLWWLSSAQSFRFRILWDSRPYFIVSHLRLLFLSPTATSRATVEVFDPSSTRDIELSLICALL
jgi:hypothetical protein